ncbi:MAG: hypothetical protein PWQ41_450 [Bacillota bacterium]|nr:hypothetical protein [Bacillota bacterium]MDK2855744.1 hypothetical protein [Bacillota bacterium]MDK2924676.1 hypothetical protein [Bacillota bacterium]
MKIRERIVIFAGAFGSGKTEIALNYALHAARNGQKVALVDLDIVSPYFRSRDMAEELAAKGIEVIAPAGELAQADLPVIVPRIHGALADPELTVVVDVGGDDPGATALGQFSDELKKQKYAMLLVINTCRPFTQDVAGIAQMREVIERATHLKATGLIANTNLAAETTPGIIRTGLTVVQEASRNLGLPLVAAAVRADLAPQLEDLKTHLFPIEIILQPPWFRRKVMNRDRRAIILARENQEKHPHQEQE